MTDPGFDVAVIGLGTHGSAVAAHCAAAGLSVCGIDAHTPPHARGSHHGESRIIRKAYFEDPSYVPLLQRAYVLWDELAAQSKEPLFERTGGLMVGAADGELVPGALASARLHRLQHEWLHHAALADRYPAFRLDPGMEAVFEAEAGVLRPEACVRAHLRQAAEAGADLLFGQAASIAGRDEHGVEISVGAHGGTVDVVRARRVVVAAGAGLAHLGLRVSSEIVVERQVVGHFAACDSADATRLRRLPVFAIEEQDRTLHYGFPDMGTGVKVARHHDGAILVDSNIDAVLPDDVAVLRRFLARRLPAANGVLLASATCRYTNTVDHHFRLDRREPDLMVIAACSGHGFKFAPVMGEIAACWARGRDIPYDLALFA